MNFFAFVLLVLPFYLVWNYSPILFVSSLVAFVAWIFYFFYKQREKSREIEEMVEKMSPDERAAYNEKIKNDSLVFLHGQVNLELICPHCQKKGTVHSKNYTKNKVVKGSAGGILKTDIKMNQVESGIARYCNNCGSQWNLN